jgi:ubiquinone/menaquinone biosynthesis C-methylase UbiE
LCSDYLTDEEYRTYWFRLGGLRGKVAEDIEFQNGMKIIDVGTGWGLFALEMARKLSKGEIIGIDIAFEDIRKAKNLAKNAGFHNVISFRRMDAAELLFPDNRFDLATSFLGMRDVHMTKGESGVKKAVEEMIRVVKPEGRITLCVTPPEDMETEDQRLAVKLEGEVFGAKSLSKQFYIDTFKENNATLIGTRAYRTHKKLTARQARTELREGLQIAGKIYDTRFPSFEEVWISYGKSIQTFGYGMYSKIISLVVQKKKAKPDDTDRSMPLNPSTLGRSALRQ